MKNKVIYLVMTQGKVQQKLEAAKKAADKMFAANKHPGRSFTINCSQCLITYPVEFGKIFVSCPRCESLVVLKKEKWDNLKFTTKKRPVNDETANV